jgi:unsaturated chondroitin disaccharide hydrolase
MVGPGDRTAGFFRGADGAPRFDKFQHDLGFMLGPSYGNGLRLVDDPATRVAYRDALLAGATA